MYADPRDPDFDPTDPEFLKNIPHDPAYVLQQVDRIRQELALTLDLARHDLLPPEQLPVNLDNGHRSMGIIKLDENGEITVRVNGSTPEERYDNLHAMAKGIGVTLDEAAQLEALYQRPTDPEVKE